MRRACHQQASMKGKHAWQVGKSSLHVSQPNIHLLLQKPSTCMLELVVHAIVFFARLAGIQA